jgi:hypothetical protein
MKRIALVPLAPPDPYRLIVPGPVRPRVEAQVGLGSGFAGHLDLAIELPFGFAS